MRAQTWWMLLLGGLTLLGCRRGPVDDGQVDFEAAALDASKASAYRKAASYSASRGGRALLIYEGQRLVFADYQNGYKAQDAAELYSGTKSFSCAIAVLAIEDGLLEGFEEPVSKTFVGWAEGKHAKITVRHLLTFSSGLDKSFAMVNFGLAKDKYAKALELDVIDEPGSFYRYDPAHLMVFGALIKAKLEGADSFKDKDAVAYLQRRLFDKIDIKPVDWMRDKAGNPFLARGAYLTAEDWGKYGLLILGDGRHGDDQLLDAKLLAQCFAPSQAFVGYGMTWWLNQEIPKGFEPGRDAAVPERALGPRVLAGNRLFHNSAPADLISAAGHKDNRLYVSRSEGLVIVRTSDGHRDWADADFLDTLF